MVTEHDFIAEGRRYAKMQQGKIEAQRAFIRGLEDLEQDAGIVRQQKEVLGEMIKSLDLVLRRLRPVIEKVH
jgi:hypothetical protein